MLGDTNSAIKYKEVEHVNVVIESNQNETLTTSFTLSYEDFSETYSGNTTIKVPADITYTITFSALTGYKTPSAVTYTAVGNNSRTITGTYQTTVVTVIMEDNQTDYNDIANATATVTATGISSTTLKSGQTVKIPTGTTNCKIVWSSVNNYKTPDSLTFTTSGTAATKTGTYQTEVLTINSNGGYTITVKDSSGNTIGTHTTATGTYKIPYGTTYIISGQASGSDLVWTPMTVTNTANSVSRTVPFYYNDAPIAIIAITWQGGPDNTTLGRLLIDGVQQQVFSSNSTYQYILSTTKSGTFKVEAYDITGYTKPGSVSGTYTAVQSGNSQGSNGVITATPVSIAMTFTPAVTNGIFVATSDGNLVEPSSYNTGNAVGIAVITDECRFIMDLNYQGSTSWSSNTATDLANVPTSTSTSTIATYYDGVSYTDAMMAAGSEYNTTNYAAGYCRSKTITFGSNTLTGYLGSAGEWQAVINNYSEVQSAMDVAGGFTIDWDNGTYYWSSCEYSANFAWYADFGPSTLYLDYYNKAYSSSYRCAVAFYKI